MFVFSTSSVVLYAVFSSLAGLAVLGLLLLRATPSLSSRGTAAAAASKGGEEQPLSLLETVRILGERRFRLLLPAMMYSGLSASFITAFYTSYIGAQWVGSTLIV